MTGWIVFAAIAALIIFLLLCPVVVDLQYSEKLKATIKFLFIKYELTKKREKKHKKKAKKRTTKDNKRQIKKAEKEKKPSKIKEIIDGEGLTGFISLMYVIIKILVSSVYKLFEKSYISKFNISITVASEDAQKTATLYGELCSGLYPAFSLLLSKCRHTQKYEINIIPDFGAEESTINAHIKIRAKVINILIVVLYALWKIFLDRIKNTIDKNKKSGGV